MSPVPLKRILVVEDEPDIQMLIKMSLEVLGGYTVKICSDGREALSALSEFNPDLILLDFSLPTWDGLTVFKVLRKTMQSANVPVVFLTGRVLDREMERYEQIGALDIISKPFSPRKLPATIADIWTKARARQQPIAV